MKAIDQLFPVVLSLITLWRVALMLVYCKKKRPIVCSFVQNVRVVLCADVTFNL